MNRKKMIEIKANKATVNTRKKVVKLFATLEKLRDQWKDELWAKMDSAPQMKFENGVTVSLEAEINDRWSRQQTEKLGNTDVRFVYIVRIPDFDLRGRQYKGFVARCRRHIYSEGDWHIVRDGRSLASTLLPKAEAKARELVYSSLHLIESLFAPEAFALAVDIAYHAETLKLIDSRDIRRAPDAPVVRQGDK